MRNVLRKSRAVFFGGEAFPCSDEVKELVLNRVYFHHDKSDEREFSRARQFANKMILNHVQWLAGAVLSKSDTALPQGGLFFEIMGRFVLRQKLAKYIRKFTIDEKRCIRCGWCQDICPSLSLSFTPGSPVPILDGNCQGCALCFECKQKAIRPVFAELGVKLASRWARTVYKAAPRKTLNDREIAIVLDDRFKLMKSRPELMSLRR
jgi:MinD superfamily P-loop ATPase